MQWREVSGLLLCTVALVLFTGCPRGLVHDNGAEAVAMGPEGVWPIHATSSRPHWLLRDTPGWVSAHQVGYGLYSGGEAVAVVRTVVFTDAHAAALGYERLTPDYMVRSFPGEIALMPWTDTFRTDMATAQAEVYTYFIPYARNIPSPFPGRLVKFRQGRVVVICSSIGLSDVQIAAGAAAMAWQADALDALH